MAKYHKISKEPNVMIDRINIRNALIIKRISAFSASIVF